MYGLGSVNPVIPLGLALFIPTKINETRRIKTTNPIRISSSIYVNKDCYLTMFY